MAAEEQKFNLTDVLKMQADWRRALIIDGVGNVLASTCRPSVQEIGEMTKMFDSRDATVGSGLDLCGDHFDVHRFHGNLIYGRRGDADEGEGFAMCKALKSDGKTVITIITYVFPTLSARAVPQLEEFVKRYIAL